MVKRKVNRRHSEQRNLILATLRSCKYHPNAQQLYDIVRQERPDISLSTVYRNLKLLHDLKLANSIEHRGIKRYDGRMDAHHHILCASCDRVADLDLTSFSRLGSQIGQSTGFRVLQDKLILFGICPDCEAQTSYNTGIN